MVGVYLSYCHSDNLAGRYLHYYNNLNNSWIALFDTPLIKVTAKLGYELRMLI